MKLKPKKYYGYIEEIYKDSLLIITQTPMELKTQNNKNNENNENN